MTPRLTLVMAIACGVAVANLYYAQPLLSIIAAAFGIGASKAGWIVTLSQAGYAAGLLFLVPAGDLLDRRRLVLAVLALTPVALLVAATAPSAGVLIAAMLPVGLTTVVVQVLVPFAASLATEEERGRVVGTVMSGLLVGILSGRTVAGFITGLLGWRAVFYLAAGAMVVLALVLRRELPRDVDKPRIRYPDVLRSVGRLLLDEPILQIRTAHGALGFAAMSAFWTTVAFVLAGPPYGYDEKIIGLFGLIGAGGALMASAAGRLADRGLSRPATGVLVTLQLLSFGLLWLGRHSLVAMVAGIIALDVAFQGIHVLNQSEIFGMNPAARNRINGAYMTTFFLGGAAGSAAGAALYEAGGWTAVCLLGAVLCAASLGLWAVAGALARRSREEETLVPDAEEPV